MKLKNSLHSSITLILLDLNNFIIYDNILLNRLQCDLNNAGDVTTTYTKRFKEPSLERMSEADVRLLSHTA